MASNITLSAGVRQNLLALQGTASLMSLTQNRLATGKKVNSALDNPTNFFTSSALNARASDLNALLDSIGQAQKTLEAADQGITSLTKLVESAKSIAKQARQVTEPQTVYAAVDQTGNVAFSEALATHSGAAITVTNGASYSFDIAINGGSARTINYTADGSATYAEILAGLQADFATEMAAAGFTGRVTLTANGAGTGIKLDATDSDVDFVISGTSGAGTTDATYSSTNMLDASAGLSGKTLTVQANGGTAKDIVFGTAAGQVSTFAELQTALSGTGVSASRNGSNQLVLTVNSTTGVQNSLVLSGNAAAAGAGGVGIAAGTYNGTGTAGAADTTRTNYQSQFNDILTQIDALSKDASYNGINLLNGDSLKVVFNEKGSSSLTISGVSYTALGLGLASVSGTYFQSNANIDSTITKLDGALSTLRTQASKFGSNLQTVQTRQDFTKNLVNTLQTGADALVLADTNEEGANMLALQTRQQLSTTALSLSAQADQAVLRLF